MSVIYLQGAWVSKADEATPSVADMEQDKQDRFITQLAIAERGEALLVGDERGGRYLLDLRTHRVSVPAQ